MFIAAIILCAGRGTRMNDNSKNKVCFDCAGTPVIKRIVNNMREGGVSLFVIVVGHQSKSVMNCLDGEPGVIYTYQKEQNGTGHAALCGLNALESIGYNGPVIISMGDKIIAPSVISSLINKANESKAVWGVQHVNDNYNGGRVVIHDDKPYGVVELADVAFLSLHGLTEDKYEEKLKSLRINEKKAQKILRLAKEKKPGNSIRLVDREFYAEDILSTPYANAGLYCLDTKLSIEAIKSFSSHNAQGEIYLTDALEWFSKNSSVELCLIENSDDMLTYSTKPELRTMSLKFMNYASSLINRIKSGELDNFFTQIYHDNILLQKERYVSLLNLFISKYGDKKVLITRSPGRINLMGRHIDHRGGCINVMATDRDMIFITSPRSDDVVNVTDINPTYPDYSFSITEVMGSKKYDKWIDFLNDDTIKNNLAKSKGHTSNYVKSAVARVQFDTDMPLCGMDMVNGSNIPVAAGLSSSSSIVVAVMEAVVSLNCMNYTEKEFVELCGEGEWFVGSRGGAGDHAAMKCCKNGKVVKLSFKPFEIGESATFSDKYAVLVANSMLQAKKSEGSKDKFNAKVAAYEIAFMILKREYPEYDLREFRDIADIRPYSKIYDMLKSVPETLTRGGAKALLPEYREQLDRLFSTHADPVIYELRGVALYGISECVRAKKFMEALENSDYELIGNMMKISHDGDRIKKYDYSDKVLDTLSKENTDISFQSGAYGCSVEQIDELCDLLNETAGVLGSEIVGAGLGGCVIALIDKSKANDIIAVVKKEYYDKYGYEHSANVFLSSSGSSIIY